MSADMDMSTCLDFNLGAASEAKFQALTNLYAKKTNYLISCIDSKDKEITKLKVLGKDNHRTQMIQALRNKIKEQELVTDVVKQELSMKAEMSTKEVNELVIKKVFSKQIWHQN